MNILFENRKTAIKIKRIFVEFNNSTVFLCRLSNVVAPYDTTWCGIIFTVYACRTFYTNASVPQGSVFGPTVTYLHQRLSQKSSVPDSLSILMITIYSRNQIGSWSLLSGLLIFTPPKGESFQLISLKNLSFQSISWPLGKKNTAPSRSQVFDRHEVKRLYWINFQVCCS